MPSRSGTLGQTTLIHEVLTTQVPEGATFDYIHISGTPGLGTCTTPPYGGTGEIICHENSAMAPNTTWTVSLTVELSTARDPYQARSSPRVRAATGGDA